LDTAYLGRVTAHENELNGHHREPDQHKANQADEQAANTFLFPHFFLGNDKTALQ
jgi:hypothetical protein